ncbi:MAG: RsmB/NOP family class I SAM-dependent RNA methyltransferase [Ignavibacteriales bacterium]|nr:RsmB/NOP family class I SAM-dependent RNA methyltransferase [Ignavibacteriales bacterium]
MIELSSNITDYIRTHFGEEFLINYKQYHNSQYKPYLRASLLIDNNDLEEQLNGYGINLQSIPNIKNAFRIISGEDVVSKTLQFILGKYYMQSLSSMIPALILNPGSNDSVLDLCAAPGSKTTQLAELMNNHGTLIANEISVDRLKSLVFNVDKMSLVNVGILHGKGELLSRQFENRFDKILVDAPCSALGIVQKKGEVSNWWDQRKAEAMSDLQLRLLIAAIKMCKIEGEIVYSTCTLTLEENEMVINKVMNKYPVELEEIELPVKGNEGHTKFGNEILSNELKKTRRIFPWEIESEGFFVAKLKKIDKTEPLKRTVRQEKKYDLIKSSSGKVNNYLKILSDYYGIDRNKFDDYKYLIKNNDIHFVSNDWNSDHLESFNRIGTLLGTVDKRNILQLNPLAAQVFGTAITKNIIELENVSELNVYFSGGTIKKHFEVGGQKVIKYKNYFLGTAVASKEGLKSQFPRAFRTQEIILPSI